MRLNKPIKTHTLAKIETQNFKPERKNRVGKIQQECPSIRAKHEHSEMSDVAENIGLTTNWGIRIYI